MSRIHRLPIRRDDNSFRDQTDRMFREMQMRMDGPMQTGFGSRSLSGGLRQWPEMTSWSSRVDDPTPFGDDFFQLKPRSVVLPNTDLQNSASASSSDRGSREVLDDLQTDKLFIEDADTKSRLFQMCFNVSDYNPQNIQVNVEDDCLVVEASNGDLQNGVRLNNDFVRRIQLPPEVEAEKLTSTLSADGILTVQAPCPPLYENMVLSPGANRPAPGASGGLTSQYNTLQQNTSKQVSSNQPATQTVKSHLLHEPIVVSGASPPNIPLDKPVYTAIDGGRRRLDIQLDIGTQYTAEDLVIKVDGHKITIEATHEEKAHGRVSRTSMQRQFDIVEEIDPSTVQAMIKPDGLLAISATTAWK